MASKRDYCTIEFDGASKGNPGRSGAGAVLKDGNGNVLWRGHEGMGHSTNNQSEYRAVNIGMEKALEYGYQRVRVQGDSQLVIKQLEGSWKVRSENLRDLNREASQLRNQFEYFEAKYVPRGSNYEADAEANKGVNLERGEFHEDYYY